jgi:uncharacterized SAM-binding protein YcdF (DUF218 family)
MSPPYLLSILAKFHSDRKPLGSNLQDAYADFTFGLHVSLFFTFCLVLQSTAIVRERILFIFLSKFLPIFVYPLGFSILLILIGLLFVRKARTLKKLILISMLILWTFSTAPVSQALARSLEWRYDYPEVIPDADLIIVLGGGTEPAIAPRSFVEVNSAGDRVLAAAHLYQQGKADTILLSGGNIDWLSNGDSTPADQMAALLSMMGVPESAMILETKSRNTYENAEFAKAVLAEEGFETILLVTSAMHMPRSMMLFENAGIEVLPIPVDFSVVTDQSENVSTLDLIIGLLPSAGHLSMSNNAIKEYIGIAVYSLRNIF